MIREIDWRSDLAPEDSTPFRFTGQELDAETGLYYFGARYLDPRTSRWLSVDPAIYEGDYIPSSGNGSKRLPNGGVYNHLNLHVYNYSNNNPVKYVDPDGRQPLPSIPRGAYQYGRHGSMTPVNQRSFTPSQAASRMLANWPVASGEITSLFGLRDPPPVEGLSPYHSGIDIGVPTGTPLNSTGVGTVTQVFNDTVLGNAVVIEMDNGLATLSAHLDSISVTVDSRVTAGQQIGTTGNTGRGSGPHLHFTVWDNISNVPDFANGGAIDFATTVNPMDFLPAMPAGITEQ